MANIEDKSKLQTKDAQAKESDNRKRKRGKGRRRNRDGKTKADPNRVNVITVEPKDSRLRLKLLKCLAAGCFMCLTCYLLLRIATDPGAEYGEIDLAGSTVNESESKLIPVAPSPVNSGDKSARAASPSLSIVERAARIRVQKLAEGIATTLTHAIQTTKALETRIEDVYDGVAGKRIANSRADAMVVRDIVERDRESLHTLESWQLEFETLSAPLASEDQLQSGDVGQIEKALLEMEERVNDTDRLMRRTNRELDSVIARSKAKHEKTMTLREVVDALAEKQIRDQQAAARELEAQLTKDRKARIQRAAKELREHEAKRQRIADNARKKRLELESNYLAEFAEMKSLLSPYISHGQFQLGKGLTIEKGPMSLGSIRSNQMLDETSYGRQKLFRHSGWHNDRPMGSFPKFVYITNMDERKYEIQIKKVQRFLIRYGDLMVEKGVLAK